MATRARSRHHRRPLWPEWIPDLFTTEGKVLLEEGYADLKTNRPVPRASRVSAEDYATSIVALLRTLGRFDLVRP